MSFWVVQLAKKSGTTRLEVPGISRRFAFQAYYPEKEATAWTVGFWVVQLAKKSGTTRLEVPEIKNGPASAGL
ncbi:hypothetical protein [Salimicrobium salexigens]|uniref:hypothetical protein n=1 Tax=Salimicrobium salexigens TaxID=908941 RepID=UPI00135642DD|nr:hypothetical protein [Salimicrobium salexigens]